MATRKSVSSISLHTGHRSPPRHVVASHQVPVRALAAAVGPRRAPAHFLHLAILDLDAGALFAYMRLLQVGACVSCLLVTGREDERAAVQRRGRALRGPDWASAISLYSRRSTAHAARLRRRPVACPHARRAADGDLRIRCGANRRRCGRLWFSRRSCGSEASLWTRLLWTPSTCATRGKGASTRSSGSAGEPRID